MQNQQQQGQQQQPIDWETSGYNPFFERDPRTYCANPVLEAQSSIFIQSVVSNAMIYSPFDDLMSQNLNQSSQKISADQISGGTLTSDNGALQIDLSNSQISYSDGVQQLLQIGGSSPSGTDNSLQINSASGAPLVQT